MLVDTHCHIHHPEYGDDAAGEVVFALEQGVGRVIVVGTEPVDWRRAVAFAEAHPEVDCIVGWHPNETAAYDPESLRELADLLSHPKVRALGEIGLDFHWTFAAREDQECALHDQMALAQRLGKPVVFHAREATHAVLDAIEGRYDVPVLFHCFAGTAEDAARAVALGAMFGVDGPVTYKKADDLRTVIRGIPLDRLVLETDAPYLAPVPFRGKPNRPGYVPYLRDALADLFEVSPSEIERITTENATRFFGP